VCVPGLAAPDPQDHLVDLVLVAHQEEAPEAATAGHTRTPGDRASRSWSADAVYFGAGAGAAGAGAGAAGAGAGAAGAGAAGAGAGAAAAGAGAGTTTTVGAAAGAGAVDAEPTAAPTANAAPRPRMACASDISVPDRYGMSVIAIKKSIETVPAIV